MRLIRGCGFRKVDGLYLVGGGVPVPCERLPLELPAVCPVCECGVQATRALAFLSTRLFSPIAPGECDAAACKACPLNNRVPERVGVMGIGRSFYPTPADFVTEAVRFGVSKRVSHVPRRLKLGETWVLLVHPAAITRDVHPEDCTCADKALFVHREERPGVVYMFRPVRVEVIVSQKAATPEKLNALKARGLTPVIVDVDKDGNAIEEVRSLGVPL